MMGFGITSETRSCQECGKPLPKDAPIRTKFCADCIKKHHREHSKTYYWTNKAKVDAAATETYHWYKERGICVSCHQRDALVLPDGTKLARCKRCLELGQKAQRKMRRKTKKA